MNSELCGESLHEKEGNKLKMLHGSFHARLHTGRGEVIYLWKKLVLFGDLIEHFVGLDSWFQVSSQDLGEDLKSFLCTCLWGLTAMRDLS